MRAIMHHRVLDRFFRGTRDFSMAHPDSARGKLCYIESCWRKMPQSGAHNDRDLLRIRQLILDYIVESAEERMIEDLRVIGGRQDETCRPILLDHHKETVEDSAYLANVVSGNPLPADRIELVEEVDTSCSAKRIKNLPKLRCGLTHELRKESIKSHYEER